MCVMCVCVCVCMLYVICYVCQLLRSKGKDSHLVLLVSCVLSLSLSLSLCVCGCEVQSCFNDTEWSLAMCCLWTIAKGIQLMTINIISLLVLSDSVLVWAGPHCLYKLKLHHLSKEAIPQYYNNYCLHVLYMCCTCACAQVSLLCGKACWVIS